MGVTVSDRHRDDLRGASARPRPLSGTRSLALVLGLALLLRLPTAFVEIDHHADEIWQYLEQAYGIVTGHAVRPWEYRLGIRSWLLPTLLAGPLWLGRVLQPVGIPLLLPVRLACILLSLGVVAASFGLGARRSRTHAVCAGLVAAGAFELVYFSGRALSDSVPLPLVMSAAWLLYRTRLRTRDAVAAGLLLGLCFCIRFQLGPALAVLALALVRRDGRAWFGFAGGALLALALDGAIDLAHGQRPFLWLVENLHANLVQNRSAAYGVEPPQWYLVEQLRMWLWAFVPVLALAALGARRFPLLAAAAIVNLAALSLIPHKEYRFDLVSVAIAIFLAGIGTADLLVRLARRFDRRLVAGGAVLFWIAVNATVALSPAGAAQWKSFGKLTALLRAAHAEPGACGLAVFEPGSALSAAYVYYDRATPIFVFKGADDDAATAARARTFNLVITSADRIRRIPGGYRLRRCFAAANDSGALPSIPDRCLYVRPGGCTHAPDRAFDINTVLAQHGE